MQKLYETMVIVDSSKAKEDYDKTKAAVLECITRHDATIVECIKWDDRRLTYPVAKAKRGTYILIHFEAEAEAIARIERQFQLSDVVLRALVTVDEDGVETKTGSARERAEAATATPAGTASAEAPATESAGA